METKELMIGDKVMVKVLSQIPDTYVLHTWDEYKGIDKGLLLEDMIDRLDSMKEGIEPIEIESIEYGQG